MTSIEREHRRKGTCAGDAPRGGDSVEEGACDWRTFARRSRRGSPQIASRGPGTTRTGTASGQRALTGKGGLEGRGVYPGAVGDHEGPKTTRLISRKSIRASPETVVPAGEAH